MNMDDYPYFVLVMDGRLCSMGQHSPRFPWVLYDTLLRLGYNRDVPIYRCQLSLAHGLDVYEVNVMIPFIPIEPWSRSFVSSEPDTAIKIMSHIALTSLCESRLAAIAALPIALLLIQNQENPVWQQHLEAMSVLKGPHFSVEMVAMAKYTQYLFNL
jgi:hypothetical protein